MMRKVGLRGRLLLSAAFVATLGSAAVAQEVRIYYDEYGRRIIADEYTGEILRVDPPRDGRGMRPIRREQRGYGVVIEGQDGVVRPLDDYRRGAPRDDYRTGYPRDMARGDGYPDDATREPYPEDDIYGDDRPAVEAFPEAPVAPGIPGGQPIERGGTLSDPQQTASIPSAAREKPLVPAAPTKDKVALASFQVLLDRAGASPGVIDGRWGQNVAHAQKAYAELTGRTLDPKDMVAITTLLEQTGGPAFIEYTLTQADVAGPYVAAIPADYSEKAQLAHMSFTSVTEALAERFHMDEAYLREINKGIDFNLPGGTVMVANVGPNITRKVARITADKFNEQVKAYDASGALVAVYPATIGSSDTPSPSGTVQVERVAFDPNYTYNPKINFKQGQNDKVLTIPPGPNGPVGTIWIALSKPTYGIHGTPEPSQIGKTNSHGCVRLTNWDAAELAKLVTKGVVVEFLE